MTQPDNQQPNPERYERRAEQQQRQHEATTYDERAAAQKRKHEINAGNE